MPKIRTAEPHRPWKPSPKPFVERKERNHAFYNSGAWRRLRLKFLECHPLCEECLKAGKYVTATVVDHVVPINEGGAPLDTANLQALCSKCHNIKSGSEAHRKNE